MAGSSVGLTDQAIKSIETVFSTYTGDSSSENGSSANDPFSSYSIQDFLKVCMDLIDAVKKIGSIKFSGVKVDVDFSIKKPSDTSTGDTFVSDTSTGDSSTGNGIFDPFKDTYSFIKNDIKETKIEKTEDFSTWLDNASNLALNGIRMLQKKPCPVCGKPMGFYIPKEGCCSIECAMKLISLKVLKQYKIQTNQNKEIAAKLQRIVEYINLLINLVTALPGMLIHTLKLPEIYKKYLIVELNRVFIKIKIILNDVLIWKNNLIIKILTWVKNGVIGESLQAIFSWLTVYLQQLQALKTAFNTAYNVAMNVINAVSIAFRIPGESYGFLCTPRSIIKNPSQLLVQIMPNANYNMSNFLNTMITDMRAGAAQAMTGISVIIERTFPPLQNVEYFLEPTAFKVRCFFSDYNAKMIESNILLLELFMKNGAEYLPKWEDLRLTNIFFVFGLFSGWGPTTQTCYGFPMYP